MPAFARTVDALRRIVGDERASASALAQVILKDAPMTTKVLRLANSAYFNHAHQGINTVSRAIVVLGFDPVAQLALSVALIDALLGGGVRSRVHQEMARSFSCGPGPLGDPAARRVAGRGDLHRGPAVAGW